MLRSLFSGVSGIQQFQDKMDVIGNNIANVNTTGYKAGRIDFADSFSQTLRGPSTNGNGGSSLSALQIGTGVTTSGVKSDYEQGSLNSTNLDTDLAIDGNGFFMVRDPQTDEQLATRSGEFRQDGQGFIITNTGHRLQGFSDSSLSTRGDIRIDTTGRPPASDPNAVIKNFYFGQDGKITVALSDGTSFVRGQVLLQNFQDPQSLIREGGSLYSGIEFAGPLGGAASPQTQAPTTNGLGAIKPSSLELSNVDLAGEFANLITTQRAFQASARIITSSDEMMQELVNLKR